MISRRLVVVGAMITATACSSPATTSSSTEPPTTTTTQAATPTTSRYHVQTVETPEGIPIDIHSSGSDGLSPVALLLHGSPPSTKEDISTFAALIARETGMLVYNVGWTEGGFEGVYESVKNVACAVAYARDTADTHGGDSSQITLIGMSAGGWSGATVALGGKQLSTDCASDSRPLPDKFVGIGGAYSAAVDGPVAGMLASDPEALRASDPYTYLGNNPTLRLWLVHGDADEAVPLSVSQEFQDSLVENGYQVELVVLKDAGHPGDDELSPDNEERVLEAILSAAQSQ
ncbi:MAG TPA: prolyl oligopeptidase family serine peptidase [Acidimicrobiia bacterium]|nr:prolyl oligopeptidase family serine peptidase [Acidimicrobiia bacterium]